MHTPGPFTEPRCYKKPNGHVYRVAVYGAKGAECVHDNIIPAGFQGNDEYTQEAIDNARLFGAAPDLLGALEKLAAWDQSNDDPKLISEACSMARAAIAKATLPR